MCSSKPNHDGYFQENDTMFDKEITLQANGL